MCHLTLLKWQVTLERTTIRFMDLQQVSPHEQTSAAPARSTARYIPPSLCQVYGLARRLHTNRLLCIAGKELARFTKISLNVDADDIAAALQEHPVAKRFL